jgi:hypothetical protein
MKKLAIYTILAGFAATPALAADVSVETKSSYKQNEHGDVKKVDKREAVNAKGTKSTAKAETKVDYDDEGNMKKETEVKTSNDPKGLGNKTTAKTKSTVKAEDGKVTRTLKKTVNGEVQVDSKTESHVN